MGINVFIDLPTVPAHASGAQPPIDLQALVAPDGLNSDLTFICTGKFSGAIAIQGSPDGNSWSGLAQFELGPELQQQDQFLFSPVFVPNAVVRFLRTVINGNVLEDTHISVAAERACDCGDQACECNCIDRVYTLQSQFDSQPNGDPNWLILGDVTLVQQQGGAWRATVGPDPQPTQSLFLRTGRAVAFAGDTGDIPDPPLRLRAKVYVTPSEEENGVTAITGLIDIAHTFVLAMATQSIDGFLQWSFFIQAGGSPSLTPTGIPVGTSCETANTIELDQLPDGTVNLTVDGNLIGNFPVPAPFLPHLYAPGATVIRNNPESSGAITVDYLCVSEGYVCLEDPGGTPFGSVGSWIQSASNYTSGEFSTTETAAWDLIMNISMTTMENNSILAWAAIASENDTPGAINRFRIVIDGVPHPSAFGSTEFPNADVPQSVTIVQAKVQVPAGPHTISLEWQVSAGTGSILSGSKPDEEVASMLVAEVAV